MSNAIIPAKDVGKVFLQDIKDAAKKNGISEIDACRCLCAMLGTVGPAISRRKARRKK